jgi:hypothetical protein
MNRATLALLHKKFSHSFPFPDLPSSALPCLSFLLLFFFSFPFFVDGKEETKDVRKIIYK